MENGKERRKHGAEFKYKVVKEALTTDQSVSELCKKYNISTSQFYKWQEQFLAAARDGMDGHKSGPSSSESREIAALEAKCQRMQNVIAEITAENIEFKKKLME